MPIYRYWCDMCGETFDVEHRIKDNQLTDCPICHSPSSLHIAPGAPRVSNAASTNSKVFVRQEVKVDPRAGTGKIIEETIEETRAEIERIRQEASESEWDLPFASEGK